jgi:hypothetical protein
MKKLIVGSMIALASISQAHAWGDREQGIVTGIAAVLAIQGMTRNQQYPNGQPPVVVGQGPVVMHPQYPVIIREGQPVYRQHCWPQQIGRDPFSGVPFYETRCKLQRY